MQADTYPAGWGGASSIVIADALYDRVRFPSDVVMPHFDCFQSPVGQPVFTGVPAPLRGGGLNGSRYYNETNMLHGGMLAAPHEFLVNRVLLLFQPSNDPADVERFVSSFYWELQLLERIVLRSPSLAPAAVGVPEAVLQDFGRGSFMDKNSTPSELRPVAVKAVGWELSKEQYIPSWHHFNVKFFGDQFTARVPMDFYVFLCGLRRLQVQ